MIQQVQQPGRWSDMLLRPVSRKARRAHRQSLALRSPDYFLSRYRELSEERFASSERPAQEVATEHRGMVERGAAALRDQGVFHWPGLFADPQWLKNAQQEMQQLVATWDTTFAAPEEAPSTVGDGERGAVFVKGNRSHDGRVRINYRSPQVVTASFAAVMNHPSLQELVSRYFDVTATCNYLLAERLEPSQRGDWWHVDRIVDQVKMMVLLTDVDESHGPLRFKLGTHRYQAELDPIYYSVFRRGVDYAYPPGPLVEKLPGEIQWGTGKAGDCIVFDTLGVHSGTPCRTGHRDVLVGTWFGPTRRTHSLLEMSNQRWI